MKKVAISLILLLFMMLLIFSNHVDLRVYANSKPLIHFSKPSYLVAVNKPFNVTLVIENVSDLLVWQAGIRFDPGIMQYVATTMPLDNIYGSKVTTFISTASISQGSLMVGGGRLPLEPDFTGSGKLITVTFMMNAINTTALAIEPSDYYTILTKGDLGSIEFSVAGCSVRSIQYMPDVNNDGVVDMKDVMTAAMAFNSFPSTSRWNVYADVDGNGHIDMIDICLIVFDFGMHTSGTPSGGVPGIEKLDFADSYAEKMTDSWNVHLVIENVGSAIALFDNSTMYFNGLPAVLYLMYTPIENFDQATVQPSNTTELQIMLPSGSGSPWYSGLNLEIIAVSAAGIYYTIAMTLP